MSEANLHKDPRKLQYVQETATTSRVNFIIIIYAEGKTKSLLFSTIVNQATVHVRP